MSTGSNPQTQAEWLPVSDMLQGARVTRTAPLCADIKAWDVVALTLLPPLSSVVVAPVGHPPTLPPPPQPGQAKSQTQWLQTWASNPSLKPLCVHVS